MSAAGISLNETLQKLRQITMYDVRKLFDENGLPKRISELDDDTAAAVVGIKPGLIGMEYKMADRVAAIEKAMKYHGLYSKDNEQKKDDLSELLAYLDERGSRIVPKPQP
jgi:phage terminase small subunit